MNMIINMNMNMNNTFLDNIIKLSGNRDIVTMWQFNYPDILSHLADFLIFQKVKDETKGSTVPDVKLSNNKKLY